MKIDIRQGTDEKTIKTYDVPRISMADFKDWENLTEIQIKLDKLIDVANSLVLVSDDPDYPNVSVFLPSHIQNKILQDKDSAQRFSETVMGKKLQILEIAIEICQNHQPNRFFSVRIYE